MTFMNTSPSEMPGASPSTNLTMPAFYVAQKWHHGHMFQSSFSSGKITSWHTQPYAALSWVEPKWAVLKRGGASRRRRQTLSACY
jgi:hypothetical protein